MKTFKISICFIFISIVFSSCQVQNILTDSQIDHSEKCYAKTNLLKRDSITQEYFVFTGDEEVENVDLETINIEISAKQDKWIQKKSNDCISPDPKDCMIWCKVEIPSEYKELKILKDTSQTKNFKIEKVIIYKDFFEKEELIEVLCDNELTHRFIWDLQDILRTKGYYKGDNTPKITENLMFVLKKYQLDNKLPIGTLNINTLKSLGLK
jgi:hypothetical protein